ncbi:flagellar filament capping protein FliD [Deltaproteobacteria bacterium OttesenSCG-928-K17]|nr:flagellar filament capping protein FliD [Deltaproteobacteria bacterium OttesenSCG-928-K17]
MSSTTTTTGNSTTTSGQIKWTGMSSGIDFKSVVEALVASEQRVITRQQTWQSQWQEKLKSITDLDVRLAGLKADVQGYDARDKLLARSAKSSKEDVVSITNTSTAATGVYSVEVGENIVEKVASRTFKDGDPIGAVKAKTNSAGEPIDSDNKVVGTTDPGDANILKAIAAHLSLPEVRYDDTLEVYKNSGGVVVAKYDDTGPPKAIYEFDGVTTGAMIASIDTVNNMSGRSEFILTATGDTIATSEVNPAGATIADFTVTMGGKTFTLEYNPAATPGMDGLYNGNYTIEELATAINDTIANDPLYDGPNISAEVIYDKTRDGDTYSRLIITGGEGGQKNHLYINDPTDLCLDRNYVDDPGLESWKGSANVKPVIDRTSAYTGHVNKTITVVATGVTGEQILGRDDFTFQWADTEGNKGTFTVKAEDWDIATNSLKEPIELLQGVKFDLKGNDLDVSKNFLAKDQAFTIDCQTPVIQKATDIGLAQTDKWVHRGVADLTSPVHSGSGGLFAYSYAGKEYSVTVLPDLGLSGLVERINSDPNNPGVVASVLNDGMGTATSYKLVLTGAKEGAENGIRILDSTNLSKMDTGEGTWTHAREASNSMCRVDGYPNDGVSWIQRQTNEVGDVLDGVVLTLEGPGESQITIQNDVSEMVNRIKLMIESVNFCKSYIKEQTKFSGAKLVSKVLSDGTFVRENEAGKDANGQSSSDASGVMIGNYGFQISQSTIDGLMTKAIFTREEYIKAIDYYGEKEAKLPVTVADEERDGPSQEGLYRAYLEENGLIYTRLSDIGIASDPSAQGQYIIEEAKLRECLTKNPEAVIKLFTFKPDDSVIPSYNRFSDEDPRPRIGGFSVMMGYAMSDLTRTQDDYDSNGNLVQRGKGITKVLAENYSNIISGIDTKIAREERRIAMVRQRLEDKFTRLEVLLSSLNDQSSSIQSQLNSLNNNNS